MLLKLKHWQLFLLTCATTFVIIYVEFTDLLNLPAIPLTDLQLRILQLIDFVAGGIQLAWLYEICMKLNGRLPPGKQRSTANFKFYFTVVAVLVTITSVPIGFQIGPGLSSLISLILLGCFIYTDLFAARILVLVEDNGDTVGSTFLLFLFYFIGLWWIQPRINRIFSPEFEHPDPDAPLDHNLDQQPQS